MILCKEKIEKAEKSIENFKKQFKKEFSMKLNIEYTFNEDVESVELPILETKSVIKNNK